MTYFSIEGRNFYVLLTIEAAELQNATHIGSTQYILNKKVTKKDFP